MYTSFSTWSLAARIILAVLILLFFSKDTIEVLDGNYERSEADGSHVSFDS